MCGIAGAFHFASEAAPLDITRLHHRGPDDSGQWKSPSGSTWLGHTRLAILDLSRQGGQPMHDATTGNVLVFNGEIYNHLEIRAALTGLGVAFRGTSDTETLLMGYAQWGEQVIPRLKGMFAFALYDAVDDSLLLARDRFGIKPLYLRKLPHGFAFASEVRPLLPLAPATLSRDGLSAYLQWGCSPHKRLLLEGMEEFPVGHWETFRRRARASGTRVRYWPPHPVVSDSESAEVRIRSLLENAVRQHLISDVPVACLLSGGIDSSIITALAARHSPGQVHTFSVGFPGTRIDESPYARRMAESAGTQHHHIVLQPGEVIADVQDAVQALDLPSIDAINTYIVAKRVAAAGFKVALSGLGGDELFGGYPQFRQIAKFKWLALMPRSIRDLLIQMGKGRHLLRDLPERPDAGEFDLWWRRIWNGTMLRQAGLPETGIQASNMPLLQDDFARISWAELRNYMRDMLLRDTDQMTMAHSLELRVPFLDHELAEFVLGLPGEAKLAGSHPKALLVASCRDLLPPEIYQRPKMGFDLPMDGWMRGPLASFVSNGIHEVREKDIIPGSFLDELECAFADSRLHWTKLWSLVVLGHYIRRNGISVPAA